MFPAPPNYTSASQLSNFSSSINYSGSGSSDATFSQQYLSEAYLPQDALLSGPDMNTPEGFLQNIQTAVGEIEKLQLLVRTVLTSMCVQHPLAHVCTLIASFSFRQSAYQPGIAPHHTQANITRLQYQLALTIEFLRQSGVGALPVVPMPSNPTGSMTSMPSIPSEAVLMENTTKNMQILYDQLERKQESAGIVANLLVLEKEKERS